MVNEPVCVIPQWNRHDGYCLLLLAIIGLAFQVPIAFQGQIPNDADSLLFFYPLRALQGDSSIGLWNPYLFCGFPRDANPQSQILYFPNSLFMLLPTAFGFPLLLIGHFLWGGAAMYLLLRGLRLFPSSALFGATAFLLSTFWRCKITNLGLLEGISWVPAVVYFYLLGISKHSMIPLLASAFCLAMVILAGVPHTVVYTLIFLLLLSIAFGWGSIGSFLKNFCRWFAEAGIAILLTTGVWLPAALYSPETQRTHLDLADALVGALGWNDIWRVFLGGLSQPDISRCDPWEGTCYLGVTALLLIPQGWKSMPRRLRYGLTAATLFAAFCTLGAAGSLYPWLYRFMPGWNFLNLPNRSLMLAACSLPIFAAFGYQRWFPTPSKQWYPLGLAAFSFLGILVTAWSIALTPWAWRTLMFSGLTQSFQLESLTDSQWALLLLCFWGGIIGLILLLRTLHKINERLTMGLLLSLLVAQSAQYSQRLFLDTVPASFFATPKTTHFLQEKQKNGDFFRVCGYVPLLDAVDDVRSRFIRPVFMHRLPEVDRLHEIQGYDPMYSRRYAELIRAWADQARSADRTRTLRIERLPKNLLNLLGVRYVVGYAGQELLYSGHSAQLDGPGTLESPLKIPKTVESVTFRWLLGGVANLLQGSEIGQVRIHKTDNGQETFPVRAGIEIANYILEFPTGRAQHRPAAEFRWFPIPSRNGYTKVRQYLATFSLSQPAEIDKVSIESFLPKGNWVILEIDLQTTEKKGLNPVYDQGELPIYENPEALPPAYLTQTVQRYDQVQEIVKIFDRLKPGDKIPVFFAQKEDLPLEIPPTPFEAANIGSLQYRRDESDQFTLHAKTRYDAYLVVAENYSSDWQALVDDRPVRIQRANHAFMSIPLTAGEHEIAFHYLPKMFYYGCAVSGAAGLLILLMLAMFPDRRLWLRESK